MENSLARERHAIKTQDITDDVLKGIFGKFEVSQANSKEVVGSFESYFLDAQYYIPYAGGSVKSTNEESLFGTEVELQNSVLVVKLRYESCKFFPDYLKYLDDLIEKLHKNIKNAPSYRPTPGDCIIDFHRPIHGDFILDDIRAQELLKKLLEALKEKGISGAVMVNINKVTIPVDEFVSNDFFKDLPFSKVYIEKSTVHIDKSNPEEEQQSNNENTNKQTEILVQPNDDQLKEIFDFKVVIDSPIIKGDGVSLNAQFTIRLFEYEFFINKRSMKNNYKINITQKDNALIIKLDISQLKNIGVDTESHKAALLEELFDTLYAKGLNPVAIHEDCKIHVNIEKVVNSDFFKDLTWCKSYIEMLAKLENNKEEKGQSIRVFVDSTTDKDFKEISLKKERNSRLTTNTRINQQTQLETTQKHYTKHTAAKLNDENNPTQKNPQPAAKGSKLKYVLLFLCIIVGIAVSVLLDQKYVEKNWAIGVGVFTGIFAVIGLFSIYNNHQDTKISQANIINHIQQVHSV